MSLVTLSATYGAGGSEVGPALAKRLGVPFVDRLIPTQVAEQLAVGMSAAHARDEKSSGMLARLLTNLAPMAQIFAADAVAAPLADRDFREKSEQVVREWAESGQAVILGHAGAVVLRDDPRALNVRLDGPREERLRQAMRIQGVERSVAERRMSETDHARHAYVNQFYGADAQDPGLYHLMIDSTAIDLDLCVEAVALVAERRGRDSAAEIGKQALRMPENGA